ncbi:MAG: hypothetical protein WCP66_13140 [Methylococcales bacterium]
MNKLPIDRATFEEAKTALQKLNPFIESLNQLVASNYFSEEVDIKILAEINDWTTSHSTKFTAIFETGLSQYENRPVALISACFRKHEDNQKEIALLNRTSKSLTDRHNEKVVELQKKNFSEHEINQILPFPEAEIRANAAKLAALTSESKSLWEFANDAPRFDPALLVGIELGYYLVSAEYQLAQKSA